MAHFTDLISVSKARNSASVCINKLINISNRGDRSKVFHFTEQDKLHDFIHRLKRLGHIYWILIHHNVVYNVIIGWKVLHNG